MANVKVLLGQFMKLRNKAEVEDRPLAPNGQLERADSFLEIALPNPDLVLGTRETIAFEPPPPLGSPHPIPFQPAPPHGVPSVIPFESPPVLGSPSVIPFEPAPPLGKPSVIPFEPPPPFPAQPARTKWS